MGRNLAAFAIVKLLILCSLFANTKGVHYMKSTETIDHDPTKFKDPNKAYFQVYCFKGKSKSLSQFFGTVKLTIIIDDDKKYVQYEGSNPQEVQEHFDSNNSLFNVNLFSRNRPRLSLPPFEDYCVGIETDEAYQVDLKVIPIDLWRLVQFCLGAVLFFKARRLSNNAIFFYAAGVLVGIFASSLLALYILTKFVPKPPLMYGILIGGWTLSAYFIKFVLDNLQLLYTSYRTYILWYILIVGIGSFMYFYRIGPPTNPRSKLIMKWILELLTLSIIYFSSHYDNAAIYVCLSMLVVRYIPYSLFGKLHQMYRLRYPLPRRLLTMEEYEQQGIEETNKSLRALREYVNSPKCSQWRVISTLRNPNSFAEFANGGNHVSVSEVNRFQETLSDSSDFDDTESNEQPEEHWRLHSSRSFYYNDESDDAGEQYF